MGTSVRPPAERNYLTEMQNALNAQMGIQGSLLSAERQYLPQWQALQNLSLQGGINNLSQLYAYNVPQSEALQKQMLASQGGIYAGVGQQARNAYNATLDPTTAGLYSSLANQASAGLASGRNLSDQENRLAQQSARSAMAARGMQFGNQAIAAEVLNSYNLANAREDRARQFAGNVYGVGQNNAQQAMNMYGSPLMSQLNNVSTAGLLNASGAYNQGLGSKLFTPESQYNASLITANQQNEMQARMATAQARAGLTSGLLSAAGMAAGGFLGNAGLFKGVDSGAGTIADLEG